MTINETIGLQQCGVGGLTVFSIVVFDDVFMTVCNNACFSGEGDVTGQGLAPAVSEV